MERVYEIKVSPCGTRMVWLEDDQVFKSWYDKIIHHVPGQEVLVQEGDVVDRIHFCDRFAEWMTRDYRHHLVFNGQVVHSTAESLRWLTVTTAPGGWLQVSHNGRQLLTVDYRENQRVTAPTCRIRSGFNLTDWNEATTISLAQGVSVKVYYGPQGERAEVLSCQGHGITAAVVDGELVED